MSRISSLFAATFLTLPTAAAAAPVCLIGNHPSISEGDAETVAAIVCGEIRKLGVQGLGEPRTDAMDASEVYRVSMRPLGQTIFLSLSHERNSSLVYESQLTLREIEEVPVAAPRLAEAVVTQKSVSRTASVDSLVGEETRRYGKKYGEFFFDFGILGLAVPNTDVIGAAGFTFGGAFETEDFAVLSDFRFAGGEPSDDEASFVAVGVGGRYYLSESNWAPFLTGGLTFTSVSVSRAGKSDDDWGESHQQSGLGSWVGIGVQALRHYRSRLTLDVRADLPFFELGGEHFVPITVGLTYGW